MLDSCDCHIKQSLLLSQHVLSRNTEWSEELIVGMHLGKLAHY